MASLYDINKDIEFVLEQAIDPETGKILDDALMAQYEQLQLDRSEKIENIVCFIKNLEADSKAIKEEAKNLTGRAKSAENKANHLRQYLEFCLQGEKFQSPKASVSFRKAQKVQVDENRLAEIPEEFLRYKDPEVDKTRVKEALKAGETVPGCELVESNSMIIK